ncbi:MAG: 30S ribosomal protein S18, partial [Deltaproteobacteria bacterium]|nr:30S ribosomal protein S18 [Deltaproteobacteria bacterium]
MTNNRPQKRRPFPRSKVCRFCADSSLRMDYKDPGLLKIFITERGKIVPRRISGNC